MNLWPFGNRNKRLQQSISTALDENERLCREHASVTCRIIEKAERIAKLATHQQPALVTHQQRRR